MSRENELGQPVGDALPQDWKSPAPPERFDVEGRYVHVVPLAAAIHGEDLFEVFQQDETGAGWTYLSNGPFDRIGDFMDWLKVAEASADPMFFAYLNASTGRAIGYGTLMRINAPMGSIEIGNIRMSPLMQRSAMSTEAVHLKSIYVFDSGYRRLEWKCDSLNAASCQAAERLGFTYEGTFRKAMHYKGRSRDTAWYSITDDEWPRICEAQKAWLHPENFDDDGRQRQPLNAFMKKSEPDKGPAPKGAS